MNSTTTIFGHPLHPMPIAFPVAFSRGTLVDSGIYAATHRPRHAGGPADQRMGGGRRL